MPFTGSHPAAVLPLMRLGLVPSALVIGSMAPDLPYYLPLSIDSAKTHSPVGVFGIDLLLGLLAYAVWRVLVGPLAVAIAPAALRARLPRWVRFRWSADPGPALLVIASLIAGAATHVLWDEFTHIHRWGYRHVGWLAARHGPMEGYRWAQYGSGVIGGLLIALAVRSWWRSAAVTRPAPPSALAPGPVVVVLVSVGLATLAGVGAAVARTMMQDTGIRRGLFLVATWGGGAGLVAVLLAAVLCGRSLDRSAHTATTDREEQTA